jgi:hypothetical protein
MRRLPSFGRPIFALNKDRLTLTSTPCSSSFDPNTKENNIAGKTHSHPRLNQLPLPPLFLMEFPTKKGGKVKNLASISPPKSRIHTRGRLNTITEEHALISPMFIKVFNLSLHKEYNTPTNHLVLAISLPCPKEQIYQVLMPKLLPNNWPN